MVRTGLESHVSSDRGTLNDHRSFVNFSSSGQCNREAALLTSPHQLSASWHLRKIAQLSGPLPSPGGRRRTSCQELKEVIQAKSNLSPLGESLDPTLQERWINGRYANAKVSDFFWHQGNVIIPRPFEWLKSERMTTANTGENVQQPEPSCAAAGDT